MHNPTVSSSSESEYSSFRFVVRFRVVLEALTFALTSEARTVLVGVLVRDDTRAAALLLEEDAVAVAGAALTICLVSAAFCCLFCRDAEPLPLDSPAAAEAALFEEEEQVFGILYIIVVC